MMEERTGEWRGAHGETVAEEGCPQLISRQTLRRAGLDGPLACIARGIRGDRESGT